MLIHFGVTPYLVFDGDYLPSKAATEVGRAKRREESKRIGLEMYRLGKPSQAQKELQKAVDVTPEMAGQLIRELKKLGVHYVVAPYEADAQLAYLERNGIVQGILSEDSDLLVFGAKCLLTKLDQYGDCVEINRKDFSACRDISLTAWSDAEFRLMAILSGCDYLPSITNMGLMTAYRLVRKYKTIEKILRMLQFDGKYHVPKGYLERFRQAELTFLYQRVFCPIVNDLAMVSDANLDTKPDDLGFIGIRISQETAIGVARGNLHPMTKKEMKLSGPTTSSPRTPLGHAATRGGIAFSDMKENKSIESFFKPKRRPLAELDPNSFTPSTSQQRLQQGVTATWMSSPAPRRPQLPLSSTSLPVSGPGATVSPSFSDTHQGSLSAPHCPVKRRRLCSDRLDEHDSLGTVTSNTGDRSRFFAPVEPISEKGKAKKSRSRNSEIYIWSDDSIEDVMADLPEITDYATSTDKAPELSDSKDTQQAVDEVTAPIALQNIPPPSPGVQQGDIVKNYDSQSSNPSKSTTSSEMPLTTSTTSVADSVEIARSKMDRNVRRAPFEMGQKFGYHAQPETKRLRQNPDDYRIKPGEYHKALQSSVELQSTRHGNLTPLQRISASALGRNRSGSRPSSTLTKNALNCSHDATPENGVCVTPSASPCELKSHHHSDGLLTSRTRASNDETAKRKEGLVIPDSDEEASDVLSSPETHAIQKAKFDLAGYAYSR
ncbi:MAG: hypothetical protein Q9191_002876 [Dirinaria sp. TL-2023a]